MLDQLLGLWSEEKTFLKILGAMEERESAEKAPYRALVDGLEGGARAFFIAALAYYSRRFALVITADMSRAEKVCADLQLFFPGEVCLLPPRELFINSAVFSRSEELQQIRLRFMTRLRSGWSGIYVGPAASVTTGALPPAVWYGSGLHLEPGMRLNREDLIAQLVMLGYERATLTEKSGRFSARGDIVDVFPPGSDEPLRIALFDDIVESVRGYDPESQRKTGSLERAEIFPARELFLPESAYLAGKKKIGSTLENASLKLRRSGDKETAARLNHLVTRHLERLSQPDGLDLLSSYYPFFYDKNASLIDYLRPQHLVLIDEPADTAEKVASLRDELGDYMTQATHDGDLLLAGEELLQPVESLYAGHSCPLVSLALFSDGGDLIDPAGHDTLGGDDLTTEHYNLEAKSAPAYHARWDLFANDYRGWLRERYRVFLLAGSEQRGRALLDLLRDQEVPSPPLMTGSLEEGFLIPSIKLALVTEQNLLPRRKKKRRLRREDGSISISDYRDLAVGDYVVHEQHGIAKYQGLHTLEVSGVKRDYIFLKYRGTDKLYIPVDQVEQIRKYAGADSPVPRLHSLGGGEWQRVKSRVGSAVEELARELLDLYASRKAVQGYRFSPDHPWQQEFEARFPFEETPDQAAAVDHVKADLEKDHPMDRLVCGDVGYGKTEVAMRAAFKVVMEGKQVVVLTPTTVLAQQHYRTFSERFEDFPVRVAQLSRFVTPAKQKEVIGDIAAGKIDVVIGTHRLLSRDVAFSDLGLLVIDEEQRFGVRQKEKMKKLRLEVDTLAMTATPIPRTLHLSLSGARDFSIIDTPPEDRYPVQTYVLEYSDNLLREAVSRELKRDGQVYIVFNRIERIESFAEKVRSLFPGVATAVGHGQLPEAKLERIMADFQTGAYRVLVSTTIIESGLDIPNVNTLIVYDADRFGLAQLYQIRGRVGRSNRVAYAYLTYRKDKVMSEVARKRLMAIKEFTELGSGFKIALRDLDIRGAGNILGAEQHGFITAVGFDLYTKLLDDAVAKLKHEKRVERIKPHIELPVSAYLPSSYIAAQDQKVDFYKRIYGALSIGELEEIREELIDRYGSIPEPADRLFAVARLRILASRLGITRIHPRDHRILLQFSPRSSFRSDLLEKLPADLRSSITAGSAYPFTLKVRGEKGKAPALDSLINILATLTTLMETAVDRYAAQ